MKGGIVVGSSEAALGERQKVISAKKRTIRRNTVSTSAVPFRRPATFRLGDAPFLRLTEAGYTSRGWFPEAWKSPAK